MMRKSRLVVAGLVGTLAWGCAQDERPEVQAVPELVDVHSYARPQEARVTHVALDLTPNFESRRLVGTARLQFDRAADADSIVLDVSGLEIRRVADAAGSPLGYTLGEVDETLGQALSVALPASGNEIVVEYATSPDAAAVQWLTPEQTSGGRMPFLFTQGQAILTRTWVPTQDSPGIRQTYEAVIRVPEGMQPVMSAELLTPQGEATEGGRTAYRFRMEQPIPPYLFALAIGDLEFAEIGPRSGVWAEPEVAQRAADEFAEVEQMIDAAERLYGPYRWGRYDILVLPPSFPFGGMENPRLTFVTPTVLAGDRSLVSLIAHELAHSWSGNLVTNATWDDFWLNEGFTTYLEARIMEELRGEEEAAMLRQLSRQDLEDALADMTDSPSDTHLRLDLEGRNPDDGMNPVAYDKGAAFLQTVESVVGRERLDAFLRRYFDEHAFQPMTSERFVAYMNEHLLTEEEQARVRTDEWINGPGLPDNAPQIASTRFAAVDAQVEAFANGTAPAELQTRGWTTQEWLRFLRALPDTMTAEQMRALDDAFNLTDTGNSEIRFVWLRHVIRNRYEPAMASLEEFLTSQGRRKFIAPLYQDLMNTTWGPSVARRIYREARPTYHSVTQNTVDAIVN